MQCPQCKRGDLSPVELEPHLIGAGCQECNGVLLSLIQYRYWVDNFQKKMTDVEEVASEPQEDSKGAKICPKCSKLMTKYRIGLETENRIELCSHCDEVWLDAGEWQLIKSLDVYHCLPEIFTQAWQKKIRDQRQQAHWDQHYTEIMGDEKFNKVKAFKEWMEEQESLAEIKHYLTTKF